MIVKHGELYAVKRCNQSLLWCEQQRILSHKLKQAKIAIQTNKVGQI